MQLSSLWINLSPLELTVYALKILLIGMCTYYTALKITDDTNSKKRIIPYVYILLISILSTIMKYKMSSLMVIASLIFLLSCIFAKTTYNNIGYSMIVTIISLGINYIIFFVAIIIAFFPSAVFAIDNNFWNLIIISFVQIIILQFVLRVNRIKYGISFLKSNIKSEYFDIFILNLSIGIIFLFTMFSDKEIFLSRNIFLGFIIFAIIMFITIQKSLQLYYKQKLLEKDLNETREELEKKNKEIDELEAEILSFSKKSHTLAHKQKSLEYKLQEIINKAEISKEEAKDIKERIKLLGKDLYEEKTIIELDKTGIIEIDDMLKCMQAECKKNKIDFEIQLKGNIHYMTNNLIDKDDLETLLADHIKNAIIAINHTDNINRSILVRLGKIDDVYGLHIYDSGIEFEQETLENLGEKPMTTHADESGTGMGFMNTFDTLKKCKASLTIEEYNKPNKDNYTKVISIKFDNKNEFKIKSYREKVIIKA